MDAIYLSHPIPSTPIGDPSVNLKFTPKSSMFLPRGEWGTFLQALEALLPSAIQSCVSKANLFPDRNKFCANFIKEKTGYERTPRQVGSRIQMLRGKWRGNKRELPSRLSVCPCPAVLRHAAATLHSPIPSFVPPICLLVAVFHLMLLSESG
jgi:hypothetical protein